MPDAILHAATRVIRRLTIDPTHPLRPDEIRVSVPEGFNLSGGPWKLHTDNLTKEAPTEAELNEAFTPPPSAEMEAFLDAALKLFDVANKVESNVLLPNDVRSLGAAMKGFLLALRELFKPRRIID